LKKFRGFSGKKGGRPTGRIDDGIIAEGKRYGD
jgi:hypothetical protein